MHSGGQATCTKKAVCEECGEEYGEIDPTCHLNLQRQGFKEPTQEANGYTGDLVCTDCHTIVEAGEVIDKLPVTPPEGKPEPEIPPVSPDNKPPVMLEGDKAEVSKNPDNHSGAVFRSSAPLDNLIEVKVDEKVLVKDKDYTACSGSTIITLLPSFLAGLSEGAHNIAIVSTTGTATADFSVISDPARCHQLRYHRHPHLYHRHQVIQTLLVHLQILWQIRFPKLLLQPDLPMYPATVLYPIPLR